MPAEITVRNLQKRFEALEVLRGVDFSVARGEVFALLGPNGAGKTTILHCIAGLDAPDGGEVNFASLDSPTTARRQLVGFAGESLCLPEAITPREALRFFGVLYGRKISPDVLLSQFGLTAKAAAPVRTLSQGLRQRLNLALALVHEPPVVLLDEPTNALDPNMREELFAEIARIAASGRAVVVATHSMEEAEQHCDRVAVLDRGRIIAEGSPAELVARSGAQHRITLETAAPLDPGWIAAIADIESCAVEAGRLDCRTAKPTSVVQSLLRMVDERRLALVRLHVEQPTLRDAYLRLTNPSPHE